MSSQSTSNGTRPVRPSNRDPRYMRPVFTYHDISNESVLSDCNSPSLKIVCKHCNKSFNTLKGLKLHTSRIHPIKVIQTSSDCDISNTNIDLSTGNIKRTSPLDNVFGSTSSVCIDHDNVWYLRWKKICALNGKQYDLPNGNIPKTFIQTLTKEVEALSKSEFPSERLIIFISVMLQRNKMVKQAKDIRILLTQRLQHWDENNYDLLINEALSCNKKLNGSKKDNNDDQVIKVFNRLMIRGKVRDAMNWLVEKGKNGILHPNTEIDSNGKTVFDILKEKHPNKTEPDEKLFSMPSEMSELPYMPQILISNEIVEKVARKLHGGGGPGGSNSEHWSDFILRHGQASHQLRDAVASLANKLCNHDVEWKQVHALMSCRLIALNKNPGVRPIGIGECLRRILSKCLIEVTRDDVTDACKSNQLCGGIKSGIEGGIHAMDSLFQSKCIPNSRWGMLLVDAKNAFNMISRPFAIWQARCHWPRAARYIYIIHIVVIQN